MMPSLRNSYNTRAWSLSLMIALCLLALIAISRADDVIESCATNNDCGDDNSCTTDVCVAGLCQHLFAGGQFCCQTARDCPQVKCRIRACDVANYRCAYKFDNSCPKDNGGDDNGDPGVGDLVGAIIGFIILGLLVLAFILVVIFIVIRSIVKKIRE